MTELRDSQPRVSIILPVHDEQDSLAPLLDELVDALEPLGPFEVILIDDASRDRSLERAREWKRLRNAHWLRLVKLEDRSGKSAAVLAGVERARAECVFSLDADGQNDPRDVPGMLEALERGTHQAVVGVRTRRRDSWVRRMSSRVGNAVRNAITGDKVRDAGCGVKGLRRDLWLRLPRFDGMHRFEPTLARCAGARVLEMAVEHRPRAAGRSKYGVFDRALPGLVDCFSVRWLRKRALLFEAKEEL